VAAATAVPSVVAAPPALLATPDVVHSPTLSANLSSLFNNVAASTESSEPASSEAEPEIARSPVGFNLPAPAPAKHSGKASKAKAKRDQARVAALERMLRKVATRRSQLAAESVA